MGRVRGTGTGTVNPTTPHLTGPQRDEGAEGEARLGTCAGHFRPGSTKGNRESTSGASLDLDLGHLKWAERDIGEELGAGRASEPDGTLVLFRRLLTSEVHVGILENLVQAIFEHALERVSDEGRGKAFPDTRCALFRDDSFQAADTTLVLGRIHLTGRGERKQEPKITLLTCMLHLATSRGVIPAWVRPHARTPPSMHLA
jgi:hypothetical protein